MTVREETSKATQSINLIIASAFTVATMIMAYRNIGLPPVIIVGGSGIVGPHYMWSKTYLKRPLDPQIILPPFLLTVAGLEVHMIEEYLTRFGPAMSRLFNISWTERSFLLVFAFIGPALYALTALGLYYRIPLAGFLAWFIFIGPGLAEFTHFIFPLLTPAIEPNSLADVSQVVAGKAYISQHAKLFLSNNRPLLFFGDVYSGVADDSRCVRHLSSDESDKGCACIMNTRFSMSRPVWIFDSSLATNITIVTT